MASAGKVAKTGTAAAGYSQMTAAVPGPLIPAQNGQSSSRPQAELAFHRTRDATCRRSTRWPRGGLSRAGPCTRRASRMARQTAQMTSSHPDERERAGSVGSGTRPRVTAVMRARCGDGGRIGSRSGAGRGVEVARPAHLSHRRGAVVPAAAGSGATMPLSPDLSTQPRRGQRPAESDDALHVVLHQPYAAGALAWRSARHGQHGPDRDPSGDWDDRRAVG
jgi:hypothetical protein